MAETIKCVWTLQVALDMRILSLVQTKHFLSITIGGEKILSAVLLVR